MKSSQINLSAVLLIIFLVLKLTGLINWSWWWVLSPLWIPVLIVVASLIFMAAFALVMVKFTGQNVKLTFRKKNKDV